MEEEDDEDDDPQCLAQTLLEIDYQTILDDGDDVDEFCVFKDTLQSKNFHSRRNKFVLWNVQI